MKAERPPGPTADRVARTVRALRRAAGLDLAHVAQRAADQGQPLAANALSRVELGLRRVDVDDLVALALALEVSPLRLLLPGEADGQAVALTPATTTTAAAAWRWGTGVEPLPTGGPLDLDATERFRLTSAPHLAEDDAVRVADLEAAEAALAPVTAAVRAARAQGVSSAVLLAAMRLVLRTDELRLALLERVAPPTPDTAPAEEVADHGER